MRVRMPIGLAFWKWPRIYRIVKFFDVLFRGNDTYCSTCERWSCQKYCPYC